MQDFRKLFIIYMALTVFSDEEQCEIRESGSKNQRKRQTEFRLSSGNEIPGVLSLKALISMFSSTRGG